MSASIRPALAPGVRLRREKNRTVLLVPEGVVMLNATAAATLELVDGTHTVDDIVEGLSARFEAPREELLRGVEALLRRLSERRMVRL